MTLRGENIFFVRASKLVDDVARIKPLVSLKFKISMCFARHNFHFNDAEHRFSDFDFDE